MGSHDARIFELKREEVIVTENCIKRSFIIGLNVLLAVHQSVLV
jgi:hypothetical protein